MMMWLPPRDTSSHQASAGTAPRGLGVRINPGHIACLCVSCVGRAPCVGRSLYVSGALCVGDLCVGQSLVGPFPPVSDPFHVDIRSRDGSRSGARSHGWYLWSHGEPGGRRAGPRPHTRSRPSSITCAWMRVNPIIV